MLDLIHSFVAVLNYVGMLVGGYIVGKQMDRGRKRMSIYLRNTVGIIAGVCTISSSFFTSVELFALSHFLSGINTALKIVLIVYVSEFSPANLRGTTALLLSTGNFVIQFLLQPLIHPIVFGNRDYFWMLSAIALVFCALHLIIATFFPESPKHLFLNNHDKQSAFNSLVYYQGKDVNFARIFGEYAKERELHNCARLSLRSIWKDATKRRTFIIVIISGMIPAVSAIQLKAQYIQQLLVDIGFDPNKASFGINGIVIFTTPFSFVSPYLIERVGRRPLFLVMSMFCCIEWLGLTFASSTHYGALIGLLAMGSGHVAYKLGVGSLPMILMNELSSFAAKAVTAEVLQIVPVLLSIIVVLSYSLVHTIGYAYYLSLFLISLSLFFAMCVLLPETKGTSVQLVVKNFSALAPPLLPIQTLYENDSTLQRKRGVSYYGSLSGVD
ncbi:Solute carrier family 2, facilitated glucose transporter member 7 [Aphelenchoides besseyi]|nr:Solute carrier family 2, facilitated glucose transporter member 7 [Aphelenchoides besseyi]